MNSSVRSGNVIYEYKNEHLISQLNMTIVGVELLLL